MDKIQNAKIIATKIGEEHGCLTAEITLEGRGWGCTFGGYCLDHWFSEPFEHKSIGGYGAIIELMKTLDVKSWEELKNKYVRVEFDKSLNKIQRIGHLIKDKWFGFEDYFKQIKEFNEEMGENSS